MSNNTIEIVRNANRLVLARLDAADERIKARELEARKILESCTIGREEIKKKRQIILEIEKIQIDTLEGTEGLVTEDIANPEPEADPFSFSADTAGAVRLADRLSLAVVRAGQNTEALRENLASSRRK
jgi:hypothetical protein